VRILKRKLYTYNTNEDNKYNRYLNCINKKKGLYQDSFNTSEIKELKVFIETEFLTSNRMVSYSNVLQHYN
jgi:hypothetical protein